MSLVGSLEDLGLGDILQIITLSRKSGALCLRGDDREGRIVFRDGLVGSASVKGLTPDLRGLIVEEGGMSDEAFERARATASERGVALSVVLAEELTAARFETLRRECVERAVLDMFGWEAGEFSFEVGEGDASDEFSVVLDAGINAQYLAMEGTRRTDEGHREPEVDPGDVTSFADVADEIEEEAGRAPIVEAMSEPMAEGFTADDAFEAMALSTAEKIDGDADAPEAVIVAEDEVADAPAEARVSPRTEDAVEEAFAAAMFSASSGADEAEDAPAPADSGDPASRPPVVVIDPQLPLLEWVKDALEGVFPRVHIFQKADLAVNRLRQYVTRGEWPLILVSPELAIDGAQGWRDVDELVARMKKQSPRSCVLWLGERADVGAADGDVVRPPDPAAVHLAGSDPLVGESLKSALLAALSGGGPAVRSAARQTLARVVARLGDPSTRGEVLNVVLAFAAQSFRRVALFAVRSDDAVGLAQVGLAEAGGPGDDALRGLHVSVRASQWLGELTETLQPVRGAPEGAEDTRFTGELGDRPVREAWLGPVVSSGQVVAFLYGDQLPGDDAIADTGDLEVALQEAGRALDAAVAERAQTDG